MILLGAKLGLLFGLSKHLAKKLIISYLYQADSHIFARIFGGSGKIIYLCPLKKKQKR